MERNLTRFNVTAFNAFDLNQRWYHILILCLCLTLTACGGGSSGGDADANDNDVVATLGTSDDDSDEESNDENGQDGDSGQDPGEGDDQGGGGDDQTPSAQDNTFSDNLTTARFLTQATFGPTPTDIAQLTGTSASDWFRQQIDITPSLTLPVVLANAPDDPEDEFNLLYIEATSFAFWQNSITGQDQLRQRMAFALSELLVVSNGGGEVLTDIPHAVAHYQDILINNAFGNYRDLLEHVTYAPAMGYYLTYLGSEKGDEATGRMPDENYARELLQLFTIGVAELNADGTEKLDDDGKSIETYSNTDITGLARVFTGLNLNAEAVEESVEIAFTYPMQTYPRSHSQKEKTFLGTTIAAGTGAQASITQALDHIFSHPNVGPFVGKQLIQRLVASNPSSAYVSDVAATFDTGNYVLPDGTSVGDGRRGDLQATLAAILFHPEARSIASNTGGKIREPILRFTHWARAFDVQNITPMFQFILWDTSGASSLGQHPYRSPSVFNFFRPGYKAPGTISAEQGLVAPELQITNASSIPGYINFMTYFATGQQQDIDIDELREEFQEELGMEIDVSQAQNSFLVTYDTEVGLLNDHAALVNHLNELLTYGQLSTETSNAILTTLSEMEEAEYYDEFDFISVAVLMVMTSTDYLVQQ
ncbi:DUF1800 family protein [Thalassotalea euphylliae]|uniref:DUF1800 domain-containing protein n=1 Tax=Thalassotalea euphylliae TaxID=1655234 RepID=UPI00363A38FC